MKRSVSDSDDSFTTPREKLATSIASQKSISTALWNGPKTELTCFLRFVTAVVCSSLSKNVISETLTSKPAASNRWNITISAITTTATCRFNFKLLNLDARESPFILLSPGLKAPDNFICCLLAGQPSWSVLNWKYLPKQTSLSPFCCHLWAQARTWEQELLQTGPFQGWRVTIGTSWTAPPKESVAETMNRFKTLHQIFRVVLDRSTTFEKRPAASPRLKRRENRVLMFMRLTRLWRDDFKRQTKIPSFFSRTVSQNGAPNFSVLTGQQTLVLHEPDMFFWRVWLSAHLEPVTRKSHQRYQTKHQPAVTFEYTDPKSPKRNLENMGGALCASSDNESANSYGDWNEDCEGVSVDTNHFQIGVSRLTLPPPQNCPQ